jgi:hypothetical protein
MTFCVELRGEPMKFKHDYRDRFNILSDRFDDIFFYRITREPRTLLPDWLYFRLLDRLRSVGRPISQSLVNR